MKFITVTFRSVTIKAYKPELVEMHMLGQIEMNFNKLGYRVIRWLSEN